MWSRYSWISTILVFESTTISDEAGASALRKEPIGNSNQTVSLRQSNFNATLRE